MDGRPRLLLAAAALCAAPAGFSLLSGAVHAASGLPVTRLVEAAFAAAGVTNASPLPVRQGWYLGAYILAPLAGTAIAASGAAARARPRWPFILVASAGIALALFWTVWSLLDA